MLGISREILGLWTGTEGVGFGKGESHGQGKWRRKWQLLMKMFRVWSLACMEHFWIQSRVQGAGCKIGESHDVKP